MTSRNKNGGDSMGTLYRHPMGRLVLRYSGYKKSKNPTGEAYIQSSNANARVSLTLALQDGEKTEKILTESVN